MLCYWELVEQQFIDFFRKAPTKYRLSQNDCLLS